jgi:hypothetical protein
MKKNVKNILLYTKYPNKDKNELSKLCEELIPREENEICQSFESLLARLHKPHHNILVLILQISDYEELKGIVSVHSFLNDIPIILILPGREADTIAMAHSLRPRFLTYKDNDLSDVRAVLTKMIDTGNKLESPNYDKHIK